MKSTPDHFARFGLPRRYAVDRKALDAAYERLSFEHHPDLLAAEPPERRAAAQQVSAELNEGYRILRSDSERAAYLLRLLANGTPLNAEAMPAGFLQAMFQLQEEIDELGPADAERRQALKRDVEAKLQQVLTERSALFEGIDPAQTPIAADALQVMQSNLNEEKYLRRLLERL